VSSVIIPAPGTRVISAAAAVQRRLCGTDPQAWADLAEAHNQAVLDAAGVGRGAVPSGLDVSPGLLGVARTGDPRRALREAARVARPGGRVVASLFAAPERSQGTVVHEAMSALIPPGQAGDHAPYALSAPGNLEAALADAGLRVAGTGEVICRWRYASMEDGVRSLLCSAGGARAIEAAGERAVRDVVQRALAQFQDPATGVTILANTFRWVAACR
jgi:SAM-dependent methyltransferase